MDTQELILRKITPVIINSFNQPTFLKNIVEKFKKNGFLNIFILDNNSTYSGIAELYKQLSLEGIFILYYNENLGPRYFHMSETSKFYFRDTPHIYTDPDLDFSELPHDFLTRLISLTEKYKISKAGCALEIPDDNVIVNDLLFSREMNKYYKIREHEEQFWTNLIEDGVYRAEVDTTLHLFNPKYYASSLDFMNSVRVASPGFIIKHLPWYKTTIIPQDELDFYKSQQKWSNSYANI